MVSRDLWTVTEHVIPAAHMRGYSRGVKQGKEGQLRLAIKQYVPKSREPKSDDITIVFTHESGSCKEIYEPMIDELLGQNLPIRAAWGMDIAHHGASYLLNKDIIGDAPHWLDVARDFMQMINYFGKEMPPPIYGIGISLPGTSLLIASTLHPVLFAGLILTEPVVETGHGFIWRKDQPPLNDKELLIYKISHRREAWPSREVARSSLLKSPFFSAFDPRAFDLFIEYGLRDMPTPEHPEGVTLTTPKTQELYNYGLPDPPFPGYPAEPDLKDRPDDTIAVPGFYIGGLVQVKRAVRQLFPPVLYLWGAKSIFGCGDYPQRVIDQTGVGESGGGGAASGQVSSRVLSDVGHVVPLEAPAEAAAVMAEWLRPEWERWCEEARRRAKEPSFNTRVLHPHWMERINKL